MQNLTLAVDHNMQLRGFYIGASIHKGVDAQYCDWEELGRVITGHRDFLLFQN